MQQMQMHVTIVARWLCLSLSSVRLGRDHRLILQRYSCADHDPMSRVLNFVWKLS